MPDAPAITEGWMGYKSDHARRYHYIVNGTALCGKYGRYKSALCTFAPGLPRGSADCAECYRRAVKRHAPPGTGVR